MPARRISRNTFYANFEDKDDVIRLVFESSAVLQPIRDLNRLLDLSDLEPLMERMNEQMYERLAAEGEFFKNLIGPIFGKDDTFPAHRDPGNLPAQHGAHSQDHEARGRLAHGLHRVFLRLVTGHAHAEVGCRRYARFAQGARQTSTVA